MSCSSGRWPCSAIRACRAASTGSPCPARTWASQACASSSSSGFDAASSARRLASTAMSVRSERSALAARRSSAPTLGKGRMGRPDTGVSSLCPGDAASGAGSGAAAAASGGVPRVAVRLRIDHRSGAVSRISGNEPAGHTSSSAAGWTAANASRRSLSHRSSRDHNRTRSAVTTTSSSTHVAARPGGCGVSNSPSTAASLACPVNVRVATVVGQLAAQLRHD